MLLLLVLCTFMQFSSAKDIMLQVLLTVLRMEDVLAELSLRLRNPPVFGLTASARQGLKVILSGAPSQAASATTLWRAGTAGDSSAEPLLA